jgi:hypothetical protein
VPNKSHRFDLTAQNNLTTQNNNSFFQVAVKIFLFFFLTRGRKQAERYIFEQVPCDNHNPIIQYSAVMGNVKYVRAAIAENFM